MLGGGAAAWPVAAHAQESGRTYRFGFLLPSARRLPRPTRTLPFNAHSSLFLPTAALGDGGEASVGEGIGQPLSRESQSPGADAVSSAEGNTFRTRHRKVRTTRRGRRTWHVQTLLAREPGDLAIDRSAIAAGPHREGEEP